MNTLTGQTNTDRFSVIARKDKKGFTLAEVLITLGIIGIVAVITIPGLINSYNKKITETRLEKFYSLFNQAIRLSTVENGEPEGWDEYWNASKTQIDDDGNVIDNIESVNYAFEKYIAPYMKIMTRKQIKQEESSFTTTLYILADGSAFSYRGADTRDIFFYPKNAEKCIKRPESNRSGICKFNFVFYPLENTSVWKWHYKKGLEPIMYNWDGVKESLYTTQIYGCKQGQGAGGAFCSTVIKLNGWKIPSNFPLKIQY